MEKRIQSFNPFSQSSFHMSHLLSHPSNQLKAHFNCLGWEEKELPETSFMDKGKESFIYGLYSRQFRDFTATVWRLQKLPGAMTTLK